MKKTISILVLVALTYLLPLAGTPELMLHWKMLLVTTAAIILFVSQPALSIREANAFQSSDRFTIYIILFGALSSQALSVLDWRFHWHMADPALMPILTGLGCFLLMLGLFIRLTAIRELGSYFSAVVQIKADHRVITNGIYKFMRHPSYTGAYLTIIGSTLVLPSTIGFVYASLVMLYAYHRRIKAEETTLVKHFGETYVEYQEWSWKMIPGVW